MSITAAKAAFICTQCDINITSFLLKANQNSLVFEVGTPLVSRGQYVLLETAWTYREFILKNGPGYYRSPDGDLLAFHQGDYLINMEDASYKIAPRASHGCCGWQPRDELNALCLNGHEIGTVHADSCWSGLVFRLSSPQVHIILL